MKTSELLELDCREDVNILLLLKALTKIKPLAKGEITQDKVERVLKIICSKYNYMFKLYPDIVSGETYIIWKSEIIDCKNLETICYIYGCSMFEILCKTAIKLYSIRR